MMRHDPVDYGPGNVQEDIFISVISDEEIIRFGFIRGSVHESSCRRCVLKAKCNQGWFTGMSCINAGNWLPTYKSDFRKLYKYLDSILLIRNAHQ